MHFTGNTFVLIALAILPASAWAHCEFSAPNNEQVFEAAKKWPLHPEITINAKAVLKGGVMSEYDENLYNLELELTDTESGKRIDSLCQEGALSSNAIALNGISIDTAPYVLSENTQAFGVRASYANNAIQNPADVGTITLFGFSQGRVQQLLKTTDSFNHFNEYLEGKCEGTFGENKLTIAVSRTSHNGLADLLLTKVENRGVLLQTETDCAEKSKSRNTVKSTFIFNGTEYIGSAVELKP